MLCLVMMEVSLLLAPMEVMTLMLAWAMIWFTVMEELTPFLVAMETTY